MSEKKRQESVSPDPAPVQNIKDDADKSDNRVRLPQKKQGKKKKKVSLGKDPWRILDLVVIQYLVFY